MIDVVAAVIESKGRYLIARRAAHKAQAGKWEFPGGKVEINESLSDALAREFSEEFGVSLLVGEVLLSSRHQYPEFEINLIALSATSDEEITGSTDHDRLEWFFRRTYAATSCARLTYQSRNTWNARVFPNKVQRAAQ